ncbi:MAG: hypothetical protein EOO05_01135 [Chitinophagaceae bacterium]|nr:MAG: hypothetical protein EOO05_01135 [Chitinophagaceae bacterium]
MGELERDHTIRKLESEIMNLREQLLWYKRTYEERSLAGIILDRIRNGKTRKTRARGPSTMIDPSKVDVNTASGKRTIGTLCVIVNHNYYENSIRLTQTAGQYFDWVLLDSGSGQVPPHAIRLPNIYYTGLLNNAVAIATAKGYRHLFFVCSDVLIDDTTAAGMAARLVEPQMENTGLYSPASTGGSYGFCRKQPGSQLRDVPFVEGFAFVADLGIMNRLCPVDTTKNLYGWGLDVAAGYLARQAKMNIVIDDRISMDHTVGTGYSRETAELEMLTWVNTLNDPGMSEFFKEQLAETSATDTGTTNE